MEPRLSETEFSVESNADLSNWMNQVLQSEDRAQLLMGFDAHLKKLLATRQFDQLMELAKAIPSGHPASYVVLYNLSKAFAAKGDVKRTDLFLQQTCRQMIKIFSSDSMKDIQFPMNILQQAIYIQHNLPLQAERVTLPFELKVEKRYHSVVHTTCNGFYFAKFGSRFMSSIKKFDDSALVHIHVINPLEETKAEFEDLKKRHSLEALLTMEVSNQNPVWFTCRRFMIAPHLFEQTQADHLLISDVDTEFTDESSHLLARIPDDIDAGLFEFEALPPMLLCHASLSYFSNSPQTLEFLDLLTNYINRKITEAPDLWTLDQCALFVLSRMGAQLIDESLHRHFQWGNLARLLGHTLDRYQVEQPVTYQEKLELRQKVQGTYGSFGSMTFDFESSGRVVLVRPSPGASHSKY